MPILSLCFSPGKTHQLSPNEGVVSNCKTVEVESKALRGPRPDLVLWRTRGPVSSHDGPQNTRDSLSARIFSTPSKYWAYIRILRWRQHFHRSNARRARTGDFVPSFMQCVEVNCLLTKEFSFELCLSQRPWQQVPQPEVRDNLCGKEIPLRSLTPCGHSVAKCSPNFNFREASVWTTLNESFSIPYFQVIPPLNQFLSGLKGKGSSRAVGLRMY